MGSMYVLSYQVLWYIHKCNILFVKMNRASSVPKSVLRLVLENLCSGFYQTPLMGVMAIFSTGTYAIIGTTCVESETCYGKYHEKKLIGVFNRTLSIYLYERSTCRYSRLNALNVLHVHGPCFNAPEICSNFFTRSGLAALNKGRINFI